MEASNEMNSFLDEDFLRKLERLKILARKGLKGPSKGEHHSWRSGTSLEFLDYRKYQVGDDFRYVDWNVYGRLDRLFLKLFRSEEDLSIHILLDVSLSMGQGTPPKVVYAKKLAAALGYIGLANLDRVGLTPFADSLGEARSPQKGRRAYQSILNALVAMNPEGKTDLNWCLTEYASISRQPGVAVILSDLMDPKGFEKGLEALQHRKFDITLIQVLDHEELFPSSRGYLVLKDVETRETKRITLDAGLRDSYMEKMKGFRERIREFCLERGADYCLSDTSIPFEDFLLDYLTKGLIFH